MSSAKMKKMNRSRTMSEKRAQFQAILCGDTRGVGQRFDRNDGNGKALGSAFRII
jgi:hypothetical protein